MFPLVAGNFFTKSAVEMALWDLAGKAAGKPVYELLGGKVRDVVATKWSVSGRPPEQAAEIARWALGRGFRAMKVKVGLGADADFARVAAVRAVDRPGREARRGRQRRLGRPGHGDRRHRAARSRSGSPSPSSRSGPATRRRWPPSAARPGVPIVADESLYSLADARQLARAGACDVFSIYIGKAGGIGPAAGDRRLRPASRASPAPSARTWSWASARRR